AAPRARARAARRRADAGDVVCRGRSAARISRGTRGARRTRRTRRRVLSPRARVVPRVTRRRRRRRARIRRISALLGRAGPARRAQLRVSERDELEPLVAAPHRLLENRADAGFVTCALKATLAAAAAITTGSCPIR